MRLIALLATALLLGGCNGKSPSTTTEPRTEVRLPAVELNGTYYRQPRPATIAAWLAATPPGFRFVVKALRTGSLRAFASDPEGTLPWLLAPVALVRRFKRRRSGWIAEEAHGTAREP